MENQNTTNLLEEPVRDQPRAWVTPTFERTLLKEAMSGYTGNGEDNYYYS